MPEKPMTPNRYRKEMHKSINERGAYLVRVAVQFVPQYTEEFPFPKKFSHIKAGSKSRKELSNLFYTYFASADHPFSPARSVANKACLQETGKSLLDITADALCAIDPQMAEYRQVYRNHFVSSFSDSMRGLMPAVTSQTRKMFNQAIVNNPSYRVFIKRMQGDDNRVVGMITDHIPENMPDLFPGARKLNRHFVLHVGPTNSGKTYDAIQELKKAKHGIYLAPLRLLAFEICDRLNQEGVPCNMITGEEEIIVPGAEHSSATIETLSTTEEYDVAVIDECQMIGDERRGGAWSRAVLGVCAHTVHVCSDSSCVDLVTRIIEDCGDTFEIHYNERMTPLISDEDPHFVFPGSVREKDALIVFSKQSVIAVTAELQKFGINASMIYGNLPYDVRMNEVRRFVTGETQVVVATDAIGMGLNLPIKRIVFLEQKKFDGHTMRLLTASETKQIAGRAGRKGIFDTGCYTSEFRRKAIRTAVEQELEPVEKAVMGIPESIIYIDKPLSEILKRWSDVGLSDMYSKADLSEDIELCRKLEEYVSDKKLLYDFITLGFHSAKPFLVDMSCRLAVIEQDGGAQIDERIDDVIYTCLVTEPEDLKGRSMEELEDEYLRYDLAYAYMRKFNHRRRMAGIIALKRVCSGCIIEILKTQKLETRKCKDCGKELAWNYPYSRCERCYVIERRKRGRY